jgi:hypothetical protein
MLVSNCAIHSFTILSDEKKSYGFYEINGMRH